MISYFLHARILDTCKRKFWTTKNIILTTQLILHVQARTHRYHYSTNKTTHQNRYQLYYSLHRRYNKKKKPKIKIYIIILHIDNSHSDDFASAVRIHPCCELLPGLCMLLFSQGSDRRAASIPPFPDGFKTSSPNNKVSEWPIGLLFVVENTYFDLSSTIAIIHRTRTTPPLFDHVACTFSKLRAETKFTQIIWHKYSCLLLLFASACQNRTTFVSFQLDDFHIDNIHPSIHPSIHPYIHKWE